MKRNATGYKHFTPNAKQIAECKEALPPVRVRYGGADWWGKVTGRQNKFASVYAYSRENPVNGMVDTIMGANVEFSWEAVCRAVVNGTRLNLDES